MEVDSIFVLVRSVSRYCTGTCSYRWNNMAYCTHKNTTMNKLTTKDAIEKASLDILPVSKSNDTIDAIRVVAKQLADRVYDDMQEEVERLKKELAKFSKPLNVESKYPLEIWVNIYNLWKPDSWDIHTTENGAVKNSIGAPTHLYVHESKLSTVRAELSDMETRAISAEVAIDMVRADTLKEVLKYLDKLYGNSMESAEENLLVHIDNHIASLLNAKP